MFNIKFIIVVLFLFITACSQARESTIEGHVVKVTDGDTIHVLDKFKKKHKIRLNFIDSPEKKGQPFGRQATDFLSQMIAGQTVTVQYKKKDRYKRVLGKVLLGVLGIFPP